MRLMQAGPSANERGSRHSTACFFGQASRRASGSGWNWTTNNRPGLAGWSTSTVPSMDGPLSVCCRLSQAGARQRLVRFSWPRCEAHRLAASLLARLTRVGRSVMHPTQASWRCLVPRVFVCLAAAPCLLALGWCLGRCREGNGECGEVLSWGPSWRWEGCFAEGIVALRLALVFTLTFPGRQSGCVLIDGRHRILHTAMSEDARRAGLADSWTVSCGKL